MRPLRLFQVVTRDRTRYHIRASSVAHAASKATLHLLTTNARSILVVRATRQHIRPNLDIDSLDSIQVIAALRSHNWCRFPSPTPTAPAHAHRLADVL